MCAAASPAAGAGVGLSMRTPSKNGFDLRQWWREREVGPGGGGTRMRARASPAAGAGEATHARAHHLQRRGHHAD
jgi:hypothetical protein